MARTVAAMAAMAAIFVATAAFAQAADRHAGHGTAPAASSDAMPGMDHGQMDMVPAAPKGIARRNGGPAEAALQGFSDALEVGNRELTIERLAADVRIVENGVEEDFTAYTGGHLDSDIAFLKTVRTILLDRQVRIGGGTTTIITKSRLVSNRRDKVIDIVVQETATLAQAPAGWKIVRLVWTRL